MEIVILWQRIFSQSHSLLRFSPRAEIPFDKHEDTRNPRQATSAEEDNNELNSNQTPGKAHTRSLHGIPILWPEEIFARHSSLITFGNCGAWMASCYTHITTQYRVQLGRERPAEGGD